MRGRICEPPDPTRSHGFATQLPPCRGRRQTPIRKENHASGRAAQSTVNWSVCEAEDTVETAPAKCMLAVAEAVSLSSSGTRPSELKTGPETPVGDAENAWQPEGPEAGNPHEGLGETKAM